MMNPSKSSTSPVDTHWSRILYHDLLQPSSPDASEPPAAPPHNELDVAARVAGSDVGARRARSPIASAVILLGIYVAMYLAVSGITHALANQPT